MTPKKLTFLLAPPLLMVGWAVMRGFGTDGREPGWTIAHLAWLAGYLLLGAACVNLHRLTVGETGRKPLATALLGGALLGAACLTVQMAIDLVAGFATDTNAAMGEYTEKIQAVPGVALLVYQVGPALLFCALFAQTVIAAARRRVPAMVPVLVGALVVVMIVDRTVDTPFRLTMGVATALLWIAFAIVVRAPRVPIARAA